MLSVEDEIVRNEWLAISETPEGLEEYPLEVENEICSAYISLLKTYKKYRTLPSLAYYSKDLLNAASSYINVMEQQFAAIESGTTLGKKQNDALLLGCVIKDYDEKIIAMSPVHPLKECANHIKIQMHRRNESRQKIDDIDNYLSVDIDEKALNRIFKRIKELEKEILTEEVNLSALQQKRVTLNGAAMIAKSEFSKNAEHILSSIEADDDNRRVIRYAHMAIEIIKRYRIRLQENKTDVLARTMTDCYKKLSYKKHLIEEIRMNPVTLDIYYLNGKGEQIEKKKLSAGEKQLMVISLLWALAICSKKKLPVIIDTPLSRLDSIHREALITTYFPNASDQTIILSTDSEIDQKYYELMKPHIGDEFTLVYDDELMKTSIKEGYLF